LQKRCNRHENRIDCRHPASLARFRAQALDGYEIAPYDEAELQRLRGLGVHDPCCRDPSATTSPATTGLAIAYRVSGYGRPAVLIHGYTVTFTGDFAIIANSYELTDSGVWS
jgi:hypothetical protein